MTPMTSLAINIRHMRKLTNHTQDSLGKECGVKGSSVSQWEAKENPTMPSIEHLLTMSGLFKVTVEQLVHSKDIGNCQTLSTGMDNQVLERVFTWLSLNPEVDNAILKASIKRKTYMFGLIYAICEDVKISEIAGLQLSGLVDLSNEGNDQNDESTEGESSAITKK